MKNLKLNNKLNHFAPVMSKGKVYFSRNKLNSKGKPLKTRFGGYMYSLLKANLDTQGEISNVEPIDKKDLSFFNVSAVTFSKGGKYMYFTTNAEVVGKNSRQDFNAHHLQIKRAEYVKGKGWANVTDLPFTNNEYSFAHPTLSPDNSTLYFISNILGTKGRTDIYKVSVTNHSSYGDVERLSDSINSPRTELFLFVSQDNKIYFSSNRRGGIGGYDIYGYNLETNDLTEKPKILPEPINSIGEDFSFYLMEYGRRGFFTSRRTEGKGDDDIYYFTGFRSSKPVLNLAD